MSLLHIDPSRYDQQLAEKKEAIATQFAEFSPPPIEVFTSEPLHYRMRAEFRVWHEGDDLYYIMFDSKTKERIRVDQFPAASILINQVMAALIVEIKDRTILRKRLFQVDFLSSKSNQILVSMLYHKQLDDEWQTQAAALKQRLSQQFNINIIGRARKQKICLEQDFVTEQLTVHDKTFTYQQVENSFTQPNAIVNEKMLEWAVNNTRDCNGDLLELYCGNGNFSIALAQNFNKVLATEIAKSSVDSAQLNIAENAIHNLVIARLSSEEFTQALQGEREFRRLQGIDLNSYDCQTILVDPPRSGMDTKTCELVSGYQRILYISCNPDTLARDLHQLTHTHKLVKFALFDQFPYTHHVECGVVLERIG